MSPVLASPKLIAFSPDGTELATATAKLTLVVVPPGVAVIKIVFAAADAPSPADRA